MALCLTQPMAKLMTQVEQHLDRQPPTVVIQATTWWETVLACVGLQECGLGVHLPVNVCCYIELSSNACVCMMYPSFQQLLTVAVCLIQPMAKLMTLLEQHLDRQPPTVVTQATTWLETVLACVRLQECGLGVHLPVNVCCY